MLGDEKGYFRPNTPEEINLMQPQDDKPAAEPRFTVSEGVLVGVGRTQKGTELRMTADLASLDRATAEGLMRFNIQHSPL